MDVQRKGKLLNGESLEKAIGSVYIQSCGVTEEEFPRLNMCCARDGRLPGVQYCKICPGCSVWTSIPEGASLTTASIIECLRYGYLRRIKE
jgi:hypothetical protein